MAETSVEWRDLEGEIETTLRETFGDIRATVRKNLAALMIGLVMVLRTPRGWYGRLSLSGISRAMPTRGQVAARYKRLHRFLDNPHFRTEQLSSGLLRLAAGESCPSLVPVLVDQTAVGDIQVLTGSYPVEGRAIPPAMATFEYGQLPSSRNRLEEDFLRRLAGGLPREVRFVWVMDRGYGRASLLALCRQEQWLFVIRGRATVTVEYQEEGKVKRASLGRLPHRQGVACRYRKVLYQGTKKERIDIIVYREKGFKEPWFLLVPADSEEMLPTDAVVQLYRSRMRIETSFRDFKSWLGVRGLRLKVRRAERLNRLLTGLALGYILLLALGAGRLAHQLRRELEILRKHARHGTRRTLSRLFVALLVVTDPLLLSLSNLTQMIKDCLLDLRCGQATKVAIPV
ncbi:MAG: IS4 family transposase [Candidatus Aminicenantes bacterium]|nr:IS4 family transposase [Candidatus Aminicenantes bacterium]